MPLAGRRTRERKRRQRLRAGVFALALPLSLGPSWAFWAAVPKASALVRGPQRRLLGSLLQVRLSPLGEHTGWSGCLPPWGPCLLNALGVLGVGLGRGRSEPFPFGEGNF